MLLSECPHCHMAKVINDESKADVLCDECGATFPFRDHLVPLQDRAKPEETTDSANSEPGEGEVELEYSVDQEVPGLAELLEETRNKTELTQQSGQKFYWSYRGIFIQSWRLYRTHVRALTLIAVVLLFLFAMTSAVLVYAVNPVLFAFGYAISRLESLILRNILFGSTAGILPLALLGTSWLSIFGGMLRASYDGLRGVRPSLYSSLGALKNSPRILAQVLLVCTLYAIALAILDISLSHTVAATFKDRFRSLPGILFSSFIQGLLILRFTAFMVPELMYEGGTAMRALVHGVVILSGQTLRFLFSLCPIGLGIVVLYAVNFSIFLFLPQPAPPLARVLVFGLAALLSIALFTYLCVFWACLHLALRRSSALAS